MSTHNICFVEKEEKYYVDTPTSVAVIHLLINDNIQSPHCKG